MNHHDLRIVLETDRHRISGSLRLPSEGFRSRLTDYLNAPDLEFVPLTDVTVAHLGGPGAGEVARCEYLAVGRRHVVLAMPAHDGDVTPTGEVTPAAGDAPD